MRTEREERAYQMGREDGERDGENFGMGWSWSPEDGDDWCDLNEAYDTGVNIGQIRAMRATGVIHP